MLFQKADLRIPAQLQIAYRRYDLHARYHTLEHHIKPHLVVTCPCTAMRYIVCAHFLRIFGHGYRLHHTLGTHTQRINSIFQHIPEYQVFDAALVIRLCHIHRLKRFYAQAVGTLLYALQFIFTKATCVHCHSMYFHTAHLCQEYGAISSIQSAAIG